MQIYIYISQQLQWHNLNVCSRESSTHFESMFFEFKPAVIWSTAHFVFSIFILSDCFHQSRTSFLLTPNLQLAAELFDFLAKSATLTALTWILLCNFIVLVAWMITRMCCWHVGSLAISWLTHFLMHRSMVLHINFLPLALVAQSCKRRLPTTESMGLSSVSFEHLIACGKSSLTLYWKCWVFSSFLPQGRLAGCGLGLTL